MDKATLREEIAALEERLREAKTKKPAHDTSGTHDAMVLEIEDALFDKRKALASLEGGDSENAP